MNSKVNLCIIAKNAQIVIKLNQIIIAHILFDDAFVKNEYGESIFNDYFKQLLNVIDVAAR